MAEVELENVTIDIPIFGIGSRSVKYRLISAATGGVIKVRDGHQVSVRAVDAMSLKLRNGDRLGIVGHNGAGKSTLLRLIAGIYHPSEGYVRTAGRVVPIFDLGFGMDPDSSGWENMILRGIALGLSISEIKPAMDDMGEVSELGEFLDMPIRTYSAGMLARLAFAISTSIKADVYLIDEGIGTGDAAFLRRARQRADEMVANAGILVLASHSNALISDWCENVLWMEHGRKKMLGPVNAVMAEYQASINVAGTLL